MSDLPQPKKIAILGGGVGALTTAFEITNQPGWQSRYDITVYQMGWRLGGKGASGRNRTISNRIEEHGLHLWMGFYENAFDVIRQAYAYCKDNNLTPGTPFPTYKEAFAPMNFTAVAEEYPPGKYQLWPIFWPASSEMPGDPDSADAPRSFDPSTPWGYVTALVSWIRSEVDRVAKDHNILHGILADLCDDVLAVAASADHSAANVSAANTTVMHRLERFVFRFPPDPRSHSQDEIGTLLRAIDAILSEMRQAIEYLFAGDTELRHLFIIVETGLAIAKGMIADDVINQGFSVIEQYDFIEWLGRHGCTHASSPLTISMYDACFGYAHGDPKQRNMAAGSTLYGALRLIFTYRGALMWWMEAGMGDTIFTPIYKALAHRGVKFEFFHKVTRVNLSADGAAVASIDIDVQSVAKPALAGGYEPLFNVNGLLCWPNEPFYDQLVNGDALQDSRYSNRNLESWWNDLPVYAQRTLTQGADFDLVVMGISLGALPYICPDFAAADKSGRWARMIEGVQVVRTQAFQLWMNRTPAEMGWPYADQQAPVLCGFVEPYDTYAQMDHLIPRESWAAGECKQIAYFCNAAPDDPSAPDFSHHDYPAQQLDTATSAALDFLDTHAQTIWPGGVSGADLVGYSASQPNILASQFVRINIDPTEQYVLSVKNSTQYRISSGGAPFSNLYLAGDWTRVDVNLGCVEAAIQSGIMASYAITGAPDFLFGAFRQKLQLAPPQKG
jgi:uncharacterized protein with NAD-binding domain and iron-sulfur cluster